MKITEEEFQTKYGNIKITDLENVKVESGETLTQLNGDPISALKFGGYTETELKNDLDAGKFGGHDITWYEWARDRKIKLIPNSRTGYHRSNLMMVGVNFNDDIFAWGYNPYHPDRSNDVIGVWSIAQDADAKKHGIKEIYTNQDQIFVLYNNGDVWVMGSTVGYGMLGIGDSSERVYYLVRSNISDVDYLVMSGSGYHTNRYRVYAVKTNGEVWAVGENQYGELGQGYADNHKNTWVKIDLPGTLKQIITIGAHAGQTFYLNNEGEVYSWGYQAQVSCLGHSGTTNIFTPTKVDGLDGINIQYIETAGHTRSGDSANYYTTTYAISDEGRVYAWGYNGHGQLCDGTTTNNNLPKEITYGGAFDPAVTPAVMVYSNRSLWGSFLIKTNDNKLFSVGYNGYGQLGIGNTTNMPSLTHIMDDVDYVVGHSSVAYCYHTSYMAIKTNGEIYTWGYNSNAHLGFHSVTNLTVPTRLDSELHFDGTDIKTIYMTGNSSNGLTQVLLKNGDLWSWGTQDYQEVLPMHDSRGYLSPQKTLL